jgi:hypothetical protein
MIGLSSYSIVAPAEYTLAVMDDFQMARAGLAVGIVILNVICAAVG